MSVRFEAHAEPIPGYRLLHRLGAGGFGEVWKCEAPGGIHKAVKIIHGDLRSRDNDLVRYAEQELKSLKRVKQVRHPYLLALDRYDIVDGRLIIIMELADCNLWDRFRQCREQGLPGIPRPELLTYMSEIAEVLDLFNDQFQLQHLDIKPQNLFLLYNHIKVADFGQVKDLQGWVAQVTGGITPVYAAPETFDGIITRYCDQYSLACVYQELLTGVRPFDGASMHQLFVQHTSAPPNLEPSPPDDRPALLRALAKRPEDRWPSVTQFVGALAGGSAGSRWFPGGRVEVDTPRDPHLVETNTADPAIEVFLPAFPSPTPGGSPLDEGFVPIFTPAPPELSGDGCLQPALIIGLGQTGLQVLQCFRAELERRYGCCDATPIIRMLFIDTDPHTVALAQTNNNAQQYPPLAVQEVIAAKLHRAGHYLKPRFNGRSLIEGWFDQQLLYRLPRQPQTMGVRLLGRLAFCDHYRAIMGKVQAEIEAAVSLEALQQTEARTGLERRTNRPRVYIVANLAGATGGGMFLDVAYATRHRLRRMGYESAEIIGFLVVPTADAAVTSAQQLANCYAALSELNHFLRADTIFTAHYDERNGFVKEQNPPFTQCFLINSTVGSGQLVDFASSSTATHSTFPRPSLRQFTPSGKNSARGSGPPAIATLERPTPGIESPVAMVIGQRLRFDLLTPLGRKADELRSAVRHNAAKTDENTSRCHVATFNTVTFDWPRREVVAAAAIVMTKRLLQRWTAPDVRRYQQEIPPLVATRWQQLGLEPETLTARLREVADRWCGEPLEKYLMRQTEPLQPRGWLARGPEPTHVAVVVDTFTKFFGPPTATARRVPTGLEEAFTQTTTGLQQSYANDFQLLLPELIHGLPCRWVGAEEFHRVLLARIDQLIERYQRAIMDHDALATRTYECLTQYAYRQKGLRKPTAAELAEALRRYPAARLDAILSRCLLQLYQGIREQLADQLAKVATVRQHLVAMAEKLTSAPNLAPLSKYQLLPPGCETIAHAVSRFLESLNEDDLTAVDQQIPTALNSEFSDIVAVGHNTSSRLDALLRGMIEQARQYLEARLGHVELTPMLAERFPAIEQVEEALRRAFCEAEPGWVGRGPWSREELTILGCSNHPADQVLREMAAQAIPVSDLPIVTTPDELTIYREWPAVPLAALPQLGPAAASAYESLPALNQCSLHSRLDVTRWLGVEDHQP